MSTETALPTVQAHTDLNLDRQNHEIRLLVLQPSKDPEAQIQGIRQKVSLNDNPEFEAISYACGDPTVVKRIGVNDQFLEVTTNAWSALQALRYEDRPRVLWMDSVCIDQSDLTERSWQIGLMRTIYNKALAVRVWLGSYSHDDRDAISILKEMTSTKGVHDTLWPNLHSTNRAQRMEQLHVFFNRPWWERLWVVQEVALGQHVVFHLGSDTFEFEELFAAYRVSRAYFREQLQGYRHGVFGGNEHDFMDIFESVNTLNDLRTLCSSSLAANAQSQLREVIMTWTAVSNMLRGKKVTVDKDRLYALYGLLPLSLVQDSRLEPDYSATTDDVFIGLAYSILEMSQSLMIWNFTHKDAGSTLPSWVPDWRQERPEKDESPSHLRIARERLYDASKGTPFYARRLGSRAICLKGFFVDLVREWHPTALRPTASPMLETCYGTWRGNNPFMMEGSTPNTPLPATYRDGTPGEIAFRRTVLWDTRPDAEEEGVLRRLTHDECEAMFAAHNHALNIALDEDDKVAEKSLSAEDGQRTRYMMDCALGGGFFLTSSFLYGMAQGIHVQGGDHIFIVAGNSHPILLRPSKRYADTWHVVGECYLHGFMYGLGVSAMEGLAEIKEMLYADPNVKGIKGVERNPRWDDIQEQADGLWEWLLIE